MADYRVKGWSKFQHYKDRNPKWIKLYTDLLDDLEFHSLPDASRALAPCIWLLAARYGHDGELPSLARMAFLLRRTQQEILDALKPLIAQGFVEPASGLLARPEQPAILEKERETETEAEERQKQPPRATGRRRTPESFSALEEDTTSRFVEAFNSTFRRRVGLLAELKHRVRGRLDQGIKPWRIVAAPLLVAAQSKDAKFLRTVQPDWILRDGRHPRTTREGMTSGGVDWIERAYTRADETTLDLHLSALAKAMGVLDDLIRLGVKVTEAELEETW